VKNDDVMDLIVVFSILSVFMLVLYCFGVATEFSVNRDLCEDTETYIPCSVADKTSNNSARDPQL